MLMLDAAACLASAERKLANGWKFSKKLQPIKLSECENVHQSMQSSGYGKAKVMNDEHRGDCSSTHNYEFMFLKLSLLLLLLLAELLKLLHHATWDTIIYHYLDG